jgi:hypothetical protein
MDAGALGAVEDAADPVESAGGEVLLGDLDLKPSGVGDLESDPEVETIVTRWRHAPTGSSVLRQQALPRFGVST